LSSKRKGEEEAVTPGGGLVVAESGEELTVAVAVAVALVAVAAAVVLVIVLLVVAVVAVAVVAAFLQLTASRALVAAFRRRARAIDAMDYAKEERLSDGNVKVYNVGRRSQT